MSDSEQLEQIAMDVAVLLERSEVSLRTNENNANRIHRLEEKVSNITGRLVVIGTGFVIIASLAQPIIAKIINGD